MPDVLDFVSDRTFEMPYSVRAQMYQSMRAPRSVEFGYQAEQAIEEGPLGYMGRAAQRGGYAGTSTLDRAMPYMGAGEAGGMAAMMGSLDPDEKPVETPLMSAEDVNKRFAPEGTKITDQPMRAGPARLLGQQKARELERNNVLQRFEAQAPWWDQFATGSVTYMLDPLVAGATFLPGIGEEAILSRFATAGLGRGPGARFLARGISGASALTAFQAPISAVKLGLSQEEAGDYDLRAAFRDMMFAAGMGAFLHAGFGVIGDWLHPPVKELPKPPEAPKEAPPPPDEETIFGGLPKGAPDEEPGALPTQPQPEPEEPPPLPPGGPAEDETIFGGLPRGATEEGIGPALRPQPEPEEPAPPGRRTGAMPVISQEMRRIFEEQGLRVEDARLLRQVRDLPRGGAAARDRLARLEVVERRLADPNLSVEERKALSRRRDELLSGTTPEKLKAEAAPLEQRRVLQAQRDRIAKRLEAIAAERKQAPTILGGGRNLARDMAVALQADAETKAGAARAIVSQIADGREVNATPVFDAANVRQRAREEAERAERERWLHEEGFRPELDLPQAELMAVHDAMAEARARGEIENLAEHQRRIYESGFAIGQPQMEFEAWRDAIYGPLEQWGVKDTAEREAAREEAEAAAKMPLESQMQTLAREILGAEGAKLDFATLDETGALKRSLTDVEKADLLEAAYSQAAQCLIAPEAPGAETVGKKEA